MQSYKYKARFTYTGECVCDQATNVVWLSGMGTLISDTSEGNNRKFVKYTGHWSRGKRDAYDTKSRAGAESSLTEVTAVELIIGASFTFATTIVND